MSARKIALFGLAAAFLTIGVIMLALADDRGGRIAGVLLIGAGLFAAAQGAMPEKIKPEHRPVGHTGGVPGKQVGRPVGRTPRGVSLTHAQQQRIRTDRAIYPDRYDDNGWLLPAFYFLYLDGFSEGYDGDPAGGEHAMYQQDQTDVVNDEEPIYDGESSDPDQGSDSPAYGSEPGQPIDYDTPNPHADGMTPLVDPTPASDPDDVAASMPGPFHESPSQGDLYDNEPQAFSAPEPTYESSHHTTPTYDTPSPSYDSGSSGGSSYDSGSSGSYDSGSSSF